MEKIVLLGRWQPLTNAHLGIMSEISNSNDSKIYAGISDTEISRRNPFTTEERKEMIANSCEEIGVDIKTFFQSVTVNPLLIHYNILKEVGKDYTLFGRDRATYLLARVLGSLAKLKVKYGRRLGEAATNVRELIYKNDNRWRYHVPEPVSEIIGRPHVAKRLEILNEYKIKIPSIQGLAGIFEHMYFRWFR